MVAFLYISFALLVCGIPFYILLLYKYAQKKQFSKGKTNLWTGGAALLGFIILGLTFTWAFTQRAEAIKQREIAHQKQQEANEFAIQAKQEVVRCQQQLKDEQKRAFVAEEQAKSCLQASLINTFKQSRN